MAKEMKKESVFITFEKVTIFYFLVTLFLKSASVKLFCKSYHSYKKCNL